MRWCVVVGIFLLIAGVWAVGCGLQDGGIPGTVDASRDVSGPDVGDAESLDVVVPLDAADAAPDVAPDTSPLTPPDVPGLEFWLRADKGVSLNDAGGPDGSALTVSAWADQSGAGDSARNANQPAPSLQPVFIGTDVTFNSQPAIMFGDYTQLVTGVWSQPIAQPATVLIVGRATAGGASNKYFMDSNNASAPFAVICSAAGDSAQINAGFISAGATAPATLPRVLIATFAGPNSLLNVSSNNAALVGTGTGGALGLTIGNYAGGTFYAAKGEIAEIAIWSRKLTSNEILRLNKYAGPRYNITITP